jgi:myosin heavy subunit
MINEKEKATQKTVTFVDAGGVQHTRKVPMKRHNKETPEIIESNVVRVVGGKTYISAEQVIKHARLIAAGEGGNMKRGKINVTPEHKRMARVALEKQANESEELGEDRESREFRSDFNANSALASSKPVVKKFRLKDKKTGITKGIFDTHAAALDAHKNHPARGSLTVESMNMQDILATAIEARKNLDENQEVQDVMTFKLHNFINTIYENSLDELIQENSPFDWKKGKSEISWNDNDEVPGKETGNVHKGTYGSEKHKAPSGETKEKKAVGRPAGLYAGKLGDGKYNVNRDSEKKLAVGKNVHAGRAANMQKETEAAGLKWNDVLSAHKEIKGKGEAPVTYGSLFAAVAHHLGKAKK